MSKEKINFQNKEKANMNNLLNPLVKTRKESKLDELLKEIEDLENEETEQKKE